MTRVLTIWDGDGLPDHDEELIRLLNDLGMTTSEREAWLEANKSVAWIQEKVAHLTTGEDKEWHLAVTRYYWRRVERIGRVSKAINERLDESIELTDETLAKIKDKANTRNMIAFEYGWLMQSKHSEDLDWDKIHQTISERWSESAVSYIKTKARKITRKQESNER